jgi:CubicO group peptidase (beta-lactamase class C family)
MRYPYFGKVRPLTQPVVRGFCDPSFRVVEEAFTNNFIEHAEIGAALCISVAGKVVVDLWGGHTSAVRLLEWSPDQLVNVFSVGKGITALVAAHCVQQGDISYDTVVSTIWPEFANNGKESLTLSDLLGHRAGLPAIRSRLQPGSMFDWSVMTNALALEQPWWPAGQAHGYHVNTYGFLVGEVIRRVTGRTIGQILSNLSNQYGADVYIGLPTALHARVADLQWDSEPQPESEPPGLSEEALLQLNSYSNPSGLSGSGVINTARWRSAEMPSTNTHASARGIAAMYSPLTQQGTSYLSQEILALACTEVSNGDDIVLGRATRFSRGFQLPIAERGFGPNPQAFGHYGAGGSMGFCDPTASVACGYVMNMMGKGWQNPRNRAILQSLYECL